ncbi:Peptidase family M23 [Capnocytophaga haemolytica]|jgi:peptidase M23|uniref:Glycyl-glycine endopeptidase ALE-1 n=1 Tax=Capnocytophaga haemolytica TaxID=45243 RepID=A0AAX2GZR0_9FLAO|nr:M23 family metallopeptidase [Capnocytophaga haemolytica]AMD86047.1 peptidase M23 [Capnocytophaga haemolytica]SFO16145.1 Peptidase family M23 [Capnocytophaga haemolytica]SNV14543.1 Glycyl-glycine endopeptidase ALE-1 precursor [Capnocytophaga haemolytica]
MKKIKYYYDPETLSYKRIVSRKRTKVRNVLVFLLAAALFGTLAVFIMMNSNFLLTPREVVLNREIKFLETNFEVLNKKMDLVEEVLANVQERDNNMYRVYFNAAPLTDEERKKVSSDASRYNDLKNYDSSEIVINTIKRLDTLQHQLVAQSKSLDEITKLSKAKEKFLSSIPAIQPVDNKDLKHMASGYGWRTDPFTKARKFHYGMDFTSPQGTFVYATGDGVVTRADNASAGYGNHVRIDHGYGYVTLYGHLSAYNVRPGQHVKRGDLIGRVGSTGRSEAPHLHYEVMKNGEHINPIHFYYGNLTPDEYAEMLRVSTEENQSLD